MSKYNYNLNGKTFEDYDNNWIGMGMLQHKNIIGLKGEIGLYKFIENDEVIYIGKAVEMDDTRGLYKRLNDYIRIDEGGSNALTYIHNNLNKITFEVIKLGNTIEAKAVANGLESLFIDHYKPRLNSHS